MSKIIAGFLMIFNLDNGWNGWVEAKTKIVYDVSIFATKIASFEFDDQNKDRIYNKCFNLIKKADKNPSKHIVNMETLLLFHSCVVIIADTNENYYLEKLDRDQVGYNTVRHIVNTRTIDNQ